MALPRRHPRLPFYYYFQIITPPIACLPCNNLQFSASSTVFLLFGLFDYLFLISFPWLSWSSSRIELCTVFTFTTESASSCSEGCVSSCPTLIPAPIHPLASQPQTATLLLDRPLLQTSRATLLLLFPLTIMTKDSVFFPTTLPA